MIAVLSLLLCGDTASAQDSHWWTNQYGNRARLLGGAVIGSARDLSAVYYNPGGLALVDHPDALLTGYVFELDNIKYTDVLFEGTDLSSTRFTAVAGLIAGELPFKFLGDTRLAYSFLTRHNLEYRFNRGGSVPGDSIPGFEQYDDVSAALTFETRLREYWGGVSWSVPLDSYGLGISTFVANRSQRLKYNSSINATAVAQDVNRASTRRSYDYYDWRMLFKIGLATSFDRWNVGINITTPSLHLFGQGDLAFESLLVLPDADRFAGTFQDDLKSGYSTSWAIGAGGEYIGDGWKAHLALEWFDRVDTTILDGEPFLSQTDSSVVIDPSVTNVMRGLINVAVGYEHKLSEKYSGYATFYTDWTGSEVADQSQTTTTPWNLWTLGAGAIFSVGRSEITAGLTYKFGGREDIADYDLVVDDILDDQLLSSGVDGAFSRLTLVLGFKLAFAPDI